MKALAAITKSSNPRPAHPAMPANGRDTRIDVLRALALLTIFINHIPGTIHEALTHKNFGFSDSAEAFVLISGLAAGMAYGGKFFPGARFLTTLKAWRRAGVLYVAHVVTTVATIAIFSFGALYFDAPGLLKEINIDLVINDSARALGGLATLGHQLGYNNILSMYAVVLLMLPAFLLIGQASLRLMLALSAMVWLLAGVYQIAPPNYPTDGFWFLNPLSWQFLFVIGVACAIHTRRAGRFPMHFGLVALAAAYLVLSLAWVRIPLWGVDASLGLPSVLTGFDKTFLSLPRLLHVLALAYVIVAIPALSRLFMTSGDNPLAVLGKHSLPVFIAGTLLAMGGQVMQFVHPAGGIAFDSVLIATGIALQFALAYYLEWLPTIGWGGAKAKPGALSFKSAPQVVVPAGRPLAGPALSSDPVNAKTA